MERTHGFWQLFRHPWLFDAMQTFSGARHMLQVLLDDHIRPTRGMSILDLGCGTARIAREFQEIEYVGVDNNESYIEYGRRKLTTGARLIAGDFSLASEIASSAFDVVLV